MIVYLATRQHLYTIRPLIEGWCPELSSVILTQSYEEFLQRPIPADAYIFSDIERLDPSIAEVISRAWQALATSQSPVSRPQLLNHPTRTMKRYELLRTLYEKGINQFNVLRLTEVRKPQQFPVFIRNENDHDGTLSSLLNTPEELANYLVDMDQKGDAKIGKIITEFIDTRDSEEIYRKYSAIVIAGKIIARDIHFSKDWLIKGNKIDTEAYIEEQRIYIETNPHRQQLQTIADLAQIQFGRFDYGLLNNQIQVWEINTNPILLVKRDNPFPLKLELDAYVGQQIVAAFRALESRL